MNYHIFKNMGAPSKHYGDMIVWTKSVINSCTTYKQTKAADRLIWQLRDRLPEDIASGTLKELLFLLSLKEHELLHGVD
jgi:hypothetical protein